MIEPLPCPFCGHIGLEFQEGSTFRWLLPSCGGCGASRGEVRMQTIGDGTKEEWLEAAKASAVKEWNERTPATTEEAESWLKWCYSCGEGYAGTCRGKSVNCPMK